MEEKATPTGDPLVSYFVGLDVIGQQYDAEEIEFLGYDGHGSVRMLIEDDGTLVAVYDYDAYGNALGFDPTTAATSLLYTGEFFDKTVEQYVLRARCYDTAIGRFSSFDAYEGRGSDPSTLHKYVYASDNPIYLLDPSGNFSTYASVLSGVGILGLTGGIVGYNTNRPAGFLEGFIPGWGAGRGLGASIRQGDAVGIGVNTVFLALDFLTFGGASLITGTAKAGALAKGVSRESVELLYRKIQQVITKPEFVERIVKAGFSPDELPKLASRMEEYFLKGGLGYSASAKVSWASETVFALTKSAADDWTKIAHELTHVLDDITNPGLFKLESAGTLGTMRVLQAEASAFTVQYGSKLAGQGGAFLQAFFSTAVAGGVNVGFGVVDTLAKINWWWDGYKSE